MALGDFDESSRESMNGLSLGRTMDRLGQATLVAGVGLQTAPIIAWPANLTTLLQTGPAMRGMAAAAWVSSGRSIGTQA